MKLITASILLGISITAMAHEPSAVKSCVMTNCVKKFFMCEPGSKSCRPLLSAQQKYTLDAYYLCKRLANNNCKHPDITNAMLTKIQTVDNNFNLCKLNCYRQKAPKLYKSVFK